MDLTGKTVLITGSVRGIGQHTAVAFAREGADIIGVDLPGQDQRETRLLVEAEGRRYGSLEADLAVEGAAPEVIAGAMKVGGFDVLVNNAGVLPSGPFLDRPIEEWQRTIDINIKAVMAMTHAALPALMKRHQGYVVNIASIAGLFGGSGIAAYAASKHAVVGFSESLHYELEETSVDVAWVCPSMVNTRMSDGVTRSVFIPVVEPEEIAQAVVGAVEKERQMVIVPRRMFWIARFFPGIAPGFWRWFVSVNPKRHIWRDADKPIQG
jgi:all-trans-retinol dehydrogenase (NAD+)